MKLEEMSNKICPFTLNGRDDPKSCILQRCMAFEARKVFSVSSKSEEDIIEYGCSQFNKVF